MSQFGNVKIWKCENLKIGKLVTLIMERSDMTL